MLRICQHRFEEPWFLERLKVGFSTFPNVSKHRIDTTQNFTNDEYIQSAARAHEPFARQMVRKRLRWSVCQHNTSRPRVPQVMYSDGW